MRPAIDLRHVFADFIPDELVQDTLYISIRFATAAHLCCCGCGIKVVTPIRPTDWTLVFDGKTVSLYPSIGNWSFPCRSHYWIHNNRVEWAPEWSVEQIESGRQNDRIATDKYFSAIESTAGDAPPKRLGNPKTPMRDRRPIASSLTRTPRKKKKTPPR